MGFIASFATAVKAFLVTSAVGQFIAQTAAAVLLSTVASRLFGPRIPDAVSNLSAISVMARSAVESRKIVYGQAQLSGPVVYNNLSGNDGEYLWFVVALADHESDSLVSVYLDSDEIPIADIGGGTGNGDVTASKWVGDNSKEAVYIRHHLGSSTQTADSRLVSEFSDWTSNHRLRGVTYVIVRLLYDKDTEEIWSKNGQPRDIKAVIKGKKIYDPRLDTTNGGSGSHRYSDSTTWEWSDNPALCIADYLMEVMGVDPATGIDWASVSDAADDCDVSVAIPTSSTETRFTCNGVISLGSSHKENLDKLLSSMDGRLTYSQGVWKVRASVWEASSVSLDADDLAGDVQVRGSAPKSERFNKVRGVFIDPDRGYEVVEFPHVTSASYVTRDNSESISFDLELPMTNSATMAQRLAYRQLEQGDNQLVVELPLKKVGAKVAPGDVFDLTLDDFSWSAKTFRCVEWSRNRDGTFRVVGREDESGDYTDPLEGEYAAAGSAVITVPSDVVPAPSSLAASGETAGIRLTWTNPPSRLWDWIDVYASADSSWSNASLVASVRSNEYFHPLNGSVTRYYWIRARRAPASTSIRNPDSDTSSVTATATGGTDGAAALGLVINGNFETGNSVGWTFPAGASVTTSAKRTGTYGARIPCGAFGPNILNDRFAVTAGDIVKAEAWVARDASSLPDANIRLAIRWYNSGGSLIGTSGVGTASFGTSGWQHIAGEVTAITNAVTGQIDVGESGGTTGHWFADDVRASFKGDVGADGADAFAVNYTNNSHAVPVTNTGTETWTGSGGDLFVFEGDTKLTLSTNSQGTGYPGSNSQFRLNITKVSGDTLTEPAITGSGTTTATIADWAGNLTTATVYQIDAYITGSGGGNYVLTTYATLTPADQGADGTDGTDGSDGNSVHVASVYRRSASAPSTPTGGSYNFGTNSLTAPTNWETEPPEGAAPLYVSNATFSVQGTTGIDSSTTWSTPKKIDSGGATIGSITDDGASSSQNNATAVVGVRVDSDGDIYERAGGSGSSYSSIQTWIGNASNSDYEVMLSVDQDSAAVDGASASTSTWLACSSDRTWEWTQSSQGSKTGTATIKFRRTSDNLVLSTISYSYNVLYIVI